MPDPLMGYATVNPSYHGNRAMLCDTPVAMLDDDCLNKSTPRFVGGVFNLDKSSKLSKVDKYSCCDVVQDGKVSGCIWLRENGKDYSVCLYTTGITAEHIVTGCKSHQEALDKVCAGKTKADTRRVAAIKALSKAVRS